MDNRKLLETLTDKNELIINQTRRILLLEEKLAELKRRYYNLKYSDLLIHLKSAI
jgi:hypothetical protein